MLRVDPERGDPGRIVRPCFLITRDDGDRAQELLALMRDETGRDRALYQALLNEPSQQLQRMSVILPEGPPDAIRDSDGKIRPVTQIADREPGQRSVSSNRFISSWRGAMDEIRPYS